MFSSLIAFGPNRMAGGCQCNGMGADARRLLIMWLEGRLRNDNEGFKINAENIF